MVRPDPEGEGGGPSGWTAVRRASVAAAATANEALSSSDSIEIRAAEMCKSGTVYKGELDCTEILAGLDQEGDGGGTPVFTLLFDNTHASWWSKSVHVKAQFGK